MPADRKVCDRCERGEHTGKSHMMASGRDKTLVPCMCHVCIK